MAKNYTYAEAVAIIAEGNDLEAIIDLGRRYPALVQKTTVVATKAGQDFVELMSFMPEYLTANKVNTGIKKAIVGSEDTDTEDTDTEDTDTEETADDSNEVDYDSMNAKQLWDILGKAGKRGTAKSKKKDDLLAAVKAMANDADADEANDEDEGEEEVGKYDGKSAMELFKECKARKIKAEPKKPAKYYVDLLTKADAASEEAEDDDGDDWDI